MDSIHGFEDGLFSINEVAVEKKTILFKPNILDEKWFLKEHDTSDATTLKFIADYLYSCKQYTEALSAYHKCLEHIPSTNAKLKRDAVESCIWCHIKLGDVQQAHSS